MKPELREKILAYNRQIAEKSEKAEDMEIIMEEIAKLPPGQLAHLMSDRLRSVFEKYGLYID